MSQPGDALLYQGPELTHWRDTYEGDRLFRVLMHYVAANGLHAAEKFDGRASLGNAFQPEIPGRLTSLMVPRLTDYGLLITEIPEPTPRRPVTCARQW